MSGGGQLKDAAQAFYAWLGDRDGTAPPPMADGLAAFLAGATVPADLELTGTS